MKKFSKILSVVLVVVMLFSTFAVGAFAVADGKDLGIVLKADKKVSEIVPGAAVTVTLYFDMADWNQLMSDVKVAVLYDSTVYTPDTTTRTFLGDWAGYAKDATTAKINANYGTAVKSASSMSAEEQATYNSAVMLTAGADAGLGATTKAGYSVTKDESTGISVAQCSMVFNVTGDAAAVAAGNINIKICDTVNTNQFIKATDGSSTPKNVTNGIDVTYGNILANMKEDSSPVFAKTSQIRYNGPVDGDYAPFDVRTRAAMTAEDFAAICGTDAEAVNNITDIGFIYADSSVEFNIDDAKAAIAAKATTGAYVYAPVEHIQKTATEYVWTCLIEDAVYADAVNSIGYVVVGGETYVFDAAYATDFSDLYDTWSSKIPA